MQLLLLHHISEVNITLFTPLHLSDSSCYFSEYNLSIENHVYPNVLTLNVCFKLRDEEFLYAAVMKNVQKYILLGMFTVWYCTFT